MPWCEFKRFSPIGHLHMKPNYRHKASHEWANGSVRMIKAKSYRAKSKSRSPPKERPKVDPFMLIRRGDMAEIKEKIENKEVNLNATRWSGFTLLHRAAEIGHTELCDFLINAGIPPDIRSARGWLTPLHVALGNGYLETAELLIDRGANPWKKNKYREDPFDYGCKRGFVKICDEFKAKFIAIQLKENVQRMISQPGTAKNSIFVPPLEDGAAAHEDG